MVVVFFSSLLVVLSDWRNLSLACSVFSAVVEVRGVAMGLGVILVAVVKVVPQVVWEAVGLETKAVWLSLAVEERPVVGREGAEVEKVLGKTEGVLSFSVCDVGASLDGVWVGVVVLLLVEPGGGVNLETGVFVGKGLRGKVVFVGDCNLKDRKHKTHEYRIDQTDILN